MRGAEEALRRIIGEALKEHAYQDVVTLAQVADALSVVVSRFRPESLTPEGEMDREKESAAEPEPETPSDALLAVATGSSTSSIRRSKYPQYRRDGDMLVKIAWSKKHRRPYEHRAPRRVVQLIVDKIRQRYEYVGDEQLFDATHVMPLLTPNHEEYPSYQVYLALGWLRHVGAVQKKGRAGYILRNGHASPSQLKALWEGLSSPAQTVDEPSHRSTDDEQ